MKKSLPFMFALLAIVSVSVAQNTIDNSFFEHVPYRGAFNSTTNWTTGWANWDPQNTSYNAPTITVEGELTASTTWTSGNVYLLKGFYYVREGVTLTIEPGTVIRGDKDTKGTLLIERGAKLIANGTQAQPIVFTSNQPAGSRSYGDWGGVVLCGKASINVPGGTAIIEGGPTSIYGGGTTPDDADNSGSLKFIRIEFPGIPFVPDKEINGLTLGGVGNGTQLENIQISYSGDDSFEWFGGTVNAKHLIAFRGWDDDFDTDYGFRGMVQFGVALRDKDVADPGSGSNGFESDNDGSGSTNTPVTQPIFSNISHFGPKYDLTTSINSNYKRSMHLRRNTKINIFNSVLTGCPTGLFIDGTAAQGNATMGDLKLQNCVLSGMGSFFASQFERDFFKTTSFHNDTLATNDLLKYTDPFNLTQPNFLLQASSLLNAGSYWNNVAIEAIQPKLNLNIYPNPAVSELHIQIDMQQSRKVSIMVIDLTGKVVMPEIQNDVPAGNNEFIIHVSDLQPGMYLVVIKYDNTKVTKKFFVQ